MTMKVKAAISAVCLVAVIGGISVPLYVKAENAKAEQAALVLQQEEQEALVKATAAEEAEMERVRIETMAKEAAERVEVERLALEKAAADEAARLLAEEERIALEAEEAELANTAVAGTDWYTADDASQFVPEKSVQQEQAQPQAQQPSSGASNPTGDKQYSGSEVTQEMLPPAIKWGGVDDGSLGHGAGGKDGGY